MCGFAGFLSFSANLEKEARQQILQDMGASLARRGPDDQQFYDDGTLSFVFRRLSIVDPAHGRQPIWNEDNTVFVAVNGEIYNHKELHSLLRSSHQFRTESDSEIVLHLYEEYGEELFQYLNGIYACVIWDTKTQRLLLGRDRVGVKPLYYSVTPNGIIFGSELKSLLLHPQCPREINWDDLDIIGIQQKRVVSTYVQDVNFLPAGSYGHLSAEENYHVQRYWKIDDYIAHKTTSQDEEKFKTAFTDLLEDAVVKQLMSDVPVGLFLSGGIDSSLIAGIVASNNKNIHCFSVADKTTIDVGDLQQAIDLCDEFELPLYAGLIDPHEIVSSYSLTRFEQLIALMESPRFDPEWMLKNELYKLAKRMVPGIKVILLGQGADEFAGGYSNRVGSPNLNWEDYIFSEVKPNIEYTRFYENHVPERFRSRLNQERMRKQTGLDETDYHSKMKLLINQLQHFNLWHEDRTSSFNGLEARVPFLDHRLIELLASIPDEFHDDLFWDKEIVRSALDKFVPSYPPHKQKVPFFVTDDMSSINALAHGLVRKLYPDYREKYLAVSEPLFDPSQLDDMYDKLCGLCADRFALSWELLELMSVDIFVSLCAEPKRFVSLVNTPDNCVIRALTPEELADLEGLSFADYSEAPDLSWVVTSIPQVPSDAELLMPFTAHAEQNEIVLCRNGKKDVQIGIPGSDLWVITLLDHLIQEPDQELSLEDWAQELGVDISRMVNVVMYLVNMNFIELQRIQN